MKKLTTLTGIMLTVALSNSVSARLMLVQDEVVSRATTALLQGTQSPQLLKALADSSEFSAAASALVGSGFKFLEVRQL
jgi:hypothetical protein